MRHSLAVLCVLVFVTPLLAAGRTPLPPVGALGQVLATACDQLLEVRYYDYDPPDDERWQAIGLGLPGEPDFLRAYFTVAEEQSAVFIDADRDGYAESVITWAKAREQYQTWCGAYEQIRKGH